MSFTVRKVEDPTIYVRRNIKPDILGKHRRWFLQIRTVADIFVRVFIYCILVCALIIYYIKCNTYTCKKDYMSTTS